MGQTAAKVRELIAKTDPNVMKKVEDCLKAYTLPEGTTGVAPPQNPPAAATEPVSKDDAAPPVLDNQAQAALKAIVRILTPFKEKISPDILHEVLEAAGFQLTGEEEDVADPNEVQKGTLIGNPDDVSKAFQAIPARVESEDEDFLPDSEVKKGHFHEGVKKANEAYAEHMKKMGYEKYPEAEMAKKNHGGAPVAKKGEHVAKSGDGAPDLSKLDPTARAAVEAFYAAQNAKNAEMVAKTAGLEAELTAIKVETRRRELVQKAAGWAHLALPQDQLLAQLVLADKAGKESYELVCKSFDTLNEQSRSSGLFREIGSNQNAPGTSDQSGNAWAKIEAAARGWVQKSGTAGMSDADGVTAFIQTPDGQKLYAEYKAGRKDGI